MSMSKSALMVSTSRWAPSTARVVGVVGGVDPPESHRPADRDPQVTGERHEVDGLRLAVDRAIMIVSDRWPESSCPKALVVRGRPGR